MTPPQTARGAAAVARVLRPRSVAVIGASSRADALSHSILQGLEANGFDGPVHLVGRSAQPIAGRPVLNDIALLPEGVDLAVVTLPAAAVRDAIAACVQRHVGAALVLAAGFSEVGAGAVQDEITQIASDGGLALCGPNCMGFTNNVENLSLHMRHERVVLDMQQLTPGQAGIAFIGQSGGMMGHLQRAARRRALPTSYVVSTGNEAGLDLADYLDFLVQDAATRVIVVYAEQIRRPDEFLAQCTRARQAGKHVLLLHPGRHGRARAAAQSHTGALVGDHGAMVMRVREADVLVVDGMDALIDVGELLLRWPQPPVLGPAVLTASGAMVALLNDVAEDIGLEFPALAAATEQALVQDLPAFGTPGNPLDTTAGLAPGALTRLTRTLVDDPHTGSLLIPFPVYSLKPVADLLAGVGGDESTPGHPQSTQPPRAADDAWGGPGGPVKPVVLVPGGDGARLPDDVEQAARAAGVAYWQSTERALQALMLYTAHGRWLARPRGPHAAPSAVDLPVLAPGAQPEWLGKRVLGAIGVRTPRGALARSADEALAIAADVGYPVVLKAQAAALSHKTEAGGVILNVADADALRAAWPTLHGNIARAAPALVLDGVLVEGMAPRGLELMVGAKRDPAWGPVLLLGLGGIWAEALGDVRLLSATATRDEVVAALRQLRAAALLTGFRGAPPVDLEAVADVALRIGGLMQAAPSITEVDVNPLVAYPQGQGATALDALVIVGSAEAAQ